MFKNTWCDLRNKKTGAAWFWFLRGLENSQQVPSVNQNCVFIWSLSLFGPHCPARRQQKQLIALMVSNMASYKCQILGWNPNAISNMFQKLKNIFCMNQTLNRKGQALAARIKRYRPLQLRFGSATKALLARNFGICHYFSFFEKIFGQHHLSCRGLPLRIKPYWQENLGISFFFQLFWENL